MLTVTNNDVTLPILESNYEKYEELNGTALQINFNSYKFEGNLGHDLLQPNALIEDEDNHAYRIKQITETPNGKSIVANHIYYELTGTYKDGTFNGPASFETYLNYLLDRTGWTFVNVDVSDFLSFNTFGLSNVVELMQRLIVRFNCEMEILPYRQLRFARRIGQDNDLQYRFGSNIQEISRSFDTSNIRTRIRAIGADGLTVFYDSPLSANPNFGVLEAEPVRDESISNTEELRQLAISSLNDTPEMNIDVSVLNIDGNVGDNVWIIHEELGIDFQSRILSKTSRREYRDSVVEVGNTKKRTIEDAIIDQKVEVQENKQEAQEAVEQLDEKTTAQTEEVRLFVENVEQTLNSSITLTATQIRSEVNDVENRLNSSITQTASSIRLEVQEVDRNVASLEITANQIQSNVTNLENNTNSSITQLSNNINLKVDVGGTISDINLSQGAATINADRINLNGAVLVNGSISGSTDITVDRNAAIGNALYFGGQQGSFDFIEVSGGDMSFNSFGGFNFSGGQMFLNGLRVLTTADLP